MTAPILVILAFCISLNGQELQYNVTAAKVLFVEHNFTVSILVAPEIDQVEINVTSRDNSWFGIGFDSKIMNDTYSIICSNNGSKSIVQENKLSAETPGIMLKPMIKIISDVSKSGIRMVTIHRNIKITPNYTSNYNDYYVFPISPTTINIIYSTGTTSYFNGSSDMALYASSTLWFHDDLSNNYNLPTTITLNISISIDLDIVQLNMTGPSNKWYGVGFNAADMTNTYAIICSENQKCDEKILLDGNLGNTLKKQMINKIYDKTKNNIRTVIVNRKRIITLDDSIQHASYIQFADNQTKIPIIYAYGENDQFNPGSGMYENGICDMTIVRCYPSKR